MAALPLHARMKTLIDRTAADNQVIQENMLERSGVVGDLPPIRMLDDVIADTTDLINDFAEQMIENLIFRLNVLLPRSTWKKILEIIDQASVGWMNKDRTRNKYLIGIELLYIHAKIDPVELMKVFGTASDDQNGLFDSWLMRFLDNFSSLDQFVLEADDGELKLWFDKAIRQTAVMSALRDVVKEICQETLSDDQIRELAKSIKIYTTSDDLGCLAGCTLRDGFVIIKKSLPYSSKPNDYRYKAAIIALALHESAHYFVRRAAANYGYSSPTSNLDRDMPPRMDPVKDGKRVESGRLMELKCFDNIQVDWHRIDMGLAENFFTRVTTEGQCNIRPLISSGTPGLIARKYGSLSFAADLVPPIARIE